MHYTIYKITNLVNGKIYIGKHQTNNLNDNYYSSSKILIDAIKKHGKDNFRKEILFDFDEEEDMNMKEAEIVSEEFVSRQDTYNVALGGNGGWSYINDGSNEHLDRARKASKKGFENARNHPNWGKTSFQKGDPKVAQLAIKANEYRKKYGLTKEHKNKIRQASLKREQQRRETGYYQK